MIKRQRIIRFLGTKALETLQGRVEAVLGAWCKDWLQTQPASDRGQIVVRRIRDEDVISGPGIQWQLFDRSGERVSIGMKSDGAEDIVAAMLGMEPSPQPIAHSLPASILELAMADLARRFLDGSVQGFTVEAPLPEDIEMGGRGVATVIRIGDSEISLLFSQALIARLVPPGQPKAGGLYSPRSCVRKEEVELVARIDLGLIRLGELLKLEPGDVLVTCTPLGEPLEFSVRGNGPRAASGSLGESQGRRALVITSVQTTNRSQVLA